MPRSFAVIAERQDAWVKYPRARRVGLAGPPGRRALEPPVVAFTAECPHLGCSINLAEGGKSFLCPCHVAKYDVNGQRINLVAPRPMDTLDVELSAEDDPTVTVHFRRFRTQIKEKSPLV